MRWFVRTLAAFALAGCAGAEQVPPAACDVSATADAPIDAKGPYNAGYRSFEWTYDAPGAGARKIVVNVWYPTTDPAGEPARYLGLQNDPDSFVDASLAPALSGCGYPVVVYSHGYAAWGGNASFLHRHFVSHGWVVVAPDHTGNTFLESSRPPAWMNYVRGLDIKQTLDAMQALPASDPLAGRLALSRVVMTGHSYGAFTTWSVAGSRFEVDAIRARCTAGTEKPDACSDAALAQFEAGVRDPRVVAALPLAGTPPEEWFGKTGPDAIRIPMLEMTGSMDGRGMDAVFERIQGVPLTWIDLEGGCHETFATGFCETLPVPEGQQIVRTYALSFARRHLLGDTRSQVVGIVDGTETVSPKVTYRRK